MTIMNLPICPTPSLTKPPRNQRGAVLVVALIFLVLLTILALSASSSSLLQLRMAGNLRNAQLAHFSANTALRAAEWQLWSFTKNPDQMMLCGRSGLSADGCVQYDPASNLYASGGLVYDFRNKPRWQGGTLGMEYKGPAGSGYTSPSGTMETAALAGNPRYIIEDMGEVTAPGAPPMEEYNQGSTAAAGSPAAMHAYRITARATGANDKSVVIMQSTFNALTQN